MNFMTKWMCTLVGKKIVAKLGIEEAEMADTTVTTSTPWYKSKAKLAAIIAAVVAAVGPISTAVGHPVIIPNWVIEILGAVGLYGIRDAIVK
jgi:hypothetical protein